MKKYILGFLCAMMLTGCQMGNRNNMQDETNDIQEDLRDGANDIKDGINDIGEDINDGVNDMTEDIKDGMDDTKKDNATSKLGGGPYSNYQPNTYLWNVPSFCNSVMNRYYPDSNL